jgi:predicted metal-dependent hydrolase
VDLPDGRRVAFEIHRSSRGESVRLKVNARHGLIVVAPSRLSFAKVRSLVATRAHWIADKLHTFDARSGLLGDPGAARPEALILTALSESWRIEYRPTRSHGVTARTDLEGRIVVSGAVDDSCACRSALRRWLARRAHATLVPWLDAVAKEIELPYSDVIVKNQRTRWASCSAHHRISLNVKLLFLPREQVRYVLVHELCHTLVPSHSKRFWIIVRRHEPELDSLHDKIREGWKKIPPWVNPEAS